MLTFEIDMQDPGLYGPMLNEAGLLAHVKTRINRVIRDEALRLVNPKRTDPGAVKVDWNFDVG